MTIRKPVNYLKIARQLTARRRDGIIASPAPSVPSSLSNTAQLETPVPAPNLSSHKATRKYALITEWGELAELVALLEGVPEVAFDIETYPLDDSNTALDPAAGA